MNFPARGHQPPRLFFLRPYSAKTLLSPPGSKTSKGFQRGIFGIRKITRIGPAVRAKIFLANEIRRRKHSAKSWKEKKTVERRKDKMKRIVVFLNLIGLLAAFGAGKVFCQNRLEIPVEVVEVRDLGLSDRDETKSLIEVRWRAGQIQKDRIRAFKLVLTVTYADGTRFVTQHKFQNDVFSTRVEVPSVKAFGRRPAAFITKIEAAVIAAVL
jgi:hypothetical protein